MDYQVKLLDAEERVFIEDDCAKDVEQDVCHHVAAVENGDELDLFHYARVMLVCGQVVFLWFWQHNFWNVVVHRGKQVDVAVC